MKDLIASIYAVCLSALLWAPIFAPQAKADLLINPFVFDSGPAVPSIKDSYTGTSSGDYYGNSTQVWLGRQFIPSSSYTLTSLELYLDKVNSPTGTTTIEIRDGAVSPANVLSSTTASTSSFPQDGGWVTFDMPDVALTGSTSYWIVANNSIASGTHTIQWKGGATGNGNVKYSTNNSGWSIMSTRELAFRAWGL